MQLQVRLRYAARIVLGLVFISSAILKAVSLTHFELYLFSFGIGSFDLCSVFARLLIAGEAALGLWLASGLHRRCTNIVTAIVLVAFSLFLIYSMAIGDSRSCNCFGDLVDMPPMVSLIKNAVLALLLAVAWQAGQLLPKVKAWHIITLSFITLAVVFFSFPPDAYFRNHGERQVNLSRTEWEDVSASYDLRGKRVVCLFSTECQHCVNFIGKINGFVSRGELDEKDVFEVFLRTIDDPMDARIREFNTGHGYDYDILPADVFISLTNGSFPIVLLTEDGQIVREYDYFSINEDELAAFFSGK